MTSDQSKLEILKKVEDGTLSVEEGSQLLGILDSAAAEPEPVLAEKVPQKPEEDVQQDVAVTAKVSGCWKAAWSMVVWLGAGLTALAGYWMYVGYERSGYGWGFWLSWIPLLLGVAITVLGVALMQGTWLNVRIKSDKEKGTPTNLNISMPLPLKFASWVFRNFNQYMPGDVRDKHIGEMLDEMERSVGKGEPFHIQVDDEDGEHVEVTIG